MSDLQYEAAKLPVIMAGIERRMAECKTSGEVLEVMHAAQAALHYAKVVGAANETQGDCLRMIVRAEIRMANEVDAGQARGEVATKGQRSNVRGLDISDMDDLNLDRRRVAEWRQVRDAGQEAADRAIDDQVKSGKAPTKAGIRQRLAVVEQVPRPQHVIQFSNLLRSLGMVIDDFADASEAASLCARFDANIDDDAVWEIIEFLEAFRRARKAGQAA